MLEKKSQIKAVIFDMDGVLFLSTDCHEEAFRLTLDKKDVPVFVYDDIAGMRTDEAFRFFYQKNQLPFDEELIAKLVKEKRKHALRLLGEKGKVAAGTFDLLQRLSSQYRLVLASSASLGTIELFLSLSKTRDFFDCILDGSMVEHAKPAPDIYLLAVEKLNLLPEECVVVEDALKGAEASFRAGIPLIITTPPDEKARFLQFKPIMIVSEGQEVGKILL
ncbi:MAG: HAD family phosphatase [Patescibacteria group bacterium]